MDQTVYMPGYSSAPAPAPSHGYRGGLGGAAPQGSKLATYMSRGGPQQQQQGYHDISNKMRDMSMLNRPPTPGTVTHNLDTMLSCQRTFAKFRSVWSRPSPC